jgi:hypothetical protein
LSPACTFKSDTNRHRNDLLDSVKHLESKDVGRWAPPTLSIFALPAKRVAIVCRASETAV